MMKTEGKQSLVIGDFNFCYIEKPSNTTRRYLETQNFSQIVEKPTHIEGHLLDQAYLKGQMEATAETHSKYYTDHKGIAIIIKKV